MVATSYMTDVAKEGDITQKLLLISGGCTSMMGFFVIIQLVGIFSKIGLTEPLIFYSMLYTAGAATWINVNMVLHAKPKSIAKTKVVGSPPTRRSALGQMSTAGGPEGTSTQSFLRSVKIAAGDTPAMNSKSSPKSILGRIPLLESG